MPESDSSFRLPHSPRLLGGLAGGLLVAAVVVVLIAVLGSSGHRKSAGLPALMHRGSFPTIFTEGSAIMTDPGPEIAQLHALGVNIVRVSFGWDSIAPDPNSHTPPRHFDATNPAAYPAAGWAVYDEIARDLRRDHMGLDLVLAPYPPAWAEGTGTPKESTPPPPDWKPSAPMFEKFVQAVGTRYSGHYTPPGAHRPLPRETFWSLWNEPNGGFQLAPQTIDHNTVESAPYHYRLLADAAWTALHRTGHGHDTTLIGELAPVGSTIHGAPGDYAVMTPLRFLRALYCVGADYQPLRGRAAALRHCPTTATASKRFSAENPVLFEASDFAVHPYPQALAPNEKIPDAPDDAVLAQLPRLFSALDSVQHAYGSSKRFDVYSTEFGYITTPPGTQSGTISPAKAARWINWSEYLGWRMPRLVSYDQFLLGDPAPIPGKPYRAFASGLVKSNGTRKPGWYAFRMPVWLPATHAAHGGKLEVWGGVRPAKLYAMARRAPADIQFKAPGGAWRTIATVSTRTADGYFDVDETFPSSGKVRIHWTPPSGAPIDSRVTSITVG